MVAGGFFLTSLLVMRDYGINWDGPSRMMRGQAYVRFYLGQDIRSEPERLTPLFFRHGESVSRYYFSAEERDRKVNIPSITNGNRLNNSPDSFWKSPSWARFYLGDTEQGHPALVDILSAGTNLIFFQGLHLVSDAEGYKLMYLLLASVGVFVVYAFVFDLTESKVSGVIGALTLALYPLYFGDAQINMKDPIQASFFAGAIWSFWHWTRSARGSGKGQWQWYGVFGMFVTLAMGVKWNMIFLPTIILPWLFLIRKTEEFRKWFTLKNQVVGVVVLGVVVFAFLTIITPPWWSNPILGITQLVRFYISEGVSPIRFQPDGFVVWGGFNLLPVVLFVTQAPPIVLFLVGMTIFLILGKRLQLPISTGFLLLLWFFIPMVRMSLPNTFFYGGDRQIMEVLPAAAVISGVGFWFLTKRFARFVIPMAIVCFFGLAIPILRFHPNENSYFNFLTGGLTGAVKNNLVDWTITYGNVYSQGEEYLNKHAETGSNLGLINGTMFAIDPTRLRPDINFSPSVFSGFSQSGEYLMTLFDPLNPAVFAKRYPERFLRPVHEVKIDGQVLLSIYKNDPKLNVFPKSFEREVGELKMEKKKTGDMRYFQIDLGKEEKVTKVVVTGANTSCLRGDNEWIGFVKNGQRELDPDNYYVFNEKRRLPGDAIEYDFPAEEARWIVIMPQNSRSCFESGTVKSVFFYQP